MTPEEQKTPKKTDQGTELAIERTVMAANRTLMAWIRTGMAMISFGFTIYKILQAALSEQKISISEYSPRRIGLFLIALGAASLLLGSIEYFQTLKHLNEMSVRKYKPFTYSFFVAVMLGLLGLFLFITILIHREVF